MPRKVAKAQGVLFIFQSEGLEEKPPADNSRMRTRRKVGLILAFSKLRQIRA
jgi:hypothetical protein